MLWSARSLTVTTFSLEISAEPNDTVGRKSEFLAPLVQPTHKVPCTGVFPVAVAQQHAEFIAAMR